MTIDTEEDGEPLRMVQYQENALNMNNTLDGAYTFLLHYLPPNMEFVCMSSLSSTLVHLPGCIQPGVSQLYIGSTTGGATQGKQYVSFDSKDRTYHVLIPFIMSALDVQISLGTDLNEIVTLEHRRVSGSTATPVIFTMATANHQLPIDVGVNQYALNSTRDGYYQFTIQRAVPDLTSWIARPLTNSPKDILLPSVSLVPIYTPQTMSYTITVPYLVGSLSFECLFSTGGSLVLLVPGTGQTEVLVSGSPSVWVPLNVGANTRVELESSQDGKYQLDIWREEADVTGLVFTSYDQFSKPFPVSLPLVPSFLRGRYQYDLDMPWSTETVGLVVTTDPDHTGVVTIDTEEDGSPLRMIQYQENALNMNNTLDGAYTFLLHYLPPNMESVCMSSNSSFLLSHPSCSQPSGLGFYIGSSTGGATQGETHVEFESQIRHYSLIIPFIMEELAIQIQLNQDLNEIVTLEHRQSISTVTFTVAQADQVLPIHVGSNLYALNSTRDGYYQFSIVRAVPDLSELIAHPRTNSPKDILLPIVSLVPNYTPQTLHYTITVPYLVGAISFESTFSTGGSLVLLDQAQVKRKY